MSATSGKGGMGDEVQKNITATCPSDRIPGGHKPLLRCIVKLGKNTSLLPFFFFFEGGAAITCKNELESINEEILESVCVQLREAMSESANFSTGNVVSMDWSKRLGKPLISAPEEFRNCRSLDLDSNFIVVHGAGWLGCIDRNLLELDMLNFNSQKRMQLIVTSLNLEIVRALARGMHFVLKVKYHMRPLPLLVASADVSHVISTLHSGFVPVLHGDAVVDDLQVGSTVTLFTFS
ncbi:hypothetical protein BHE74_00020676 [Ensete ventricosum]|nr:hypothetical protein BHE74_00020676 [Ensete ventricosum]